MDLRLRWAKNMILYTGNMLRGDLGEMVSLQTQTSPCFQLREKFKCIEHIGKGKDFSLKSNSLRKTSPYFRFLAWTLFIIMFKSITGFRSFLAHIGQMRLLFFSIRFLSWNTIWTCFWISDDLKSCVTLQKFWRDMIKDPAANLSQKQEHPLFQYFFIIH